MPRLLCLWQPDRTAPRAFSRPCTGLRGWPHPYHAGDVVYGPAACVWLAGVPALLLFLGNQSSAFSGWLSRLGDPSHGIYLSGCPIAQAVYALWPSMNFYASLLLACVLSIALGYVLWHLVESPALRRKRLLPSSRSAALCIALESTPLGLKRDIQLAHVLNCSLGKAQEDNATHRPLSASQGSRFCHLSIHVFKRNAGASTQCHDSQASAKTTGIQIASPAATDN